MVTVKKVSKYLLTNKNDNFLREELFYVCVIFVIKIFSRTLKTSPPPPSNFVLATAWAVRGRHGPVRFGDGTVRIRIKLIVFIARVGSSREVTLGMRVVRAAVQRLLHGHKRLETVRAFRLDFEFIDVFQAPSPTISCLDGARKPFLQASHVAMLSHRSFASFSVQLRTFFEVTLTVACFFRIFALE